jgi:ATP-dependent helicase/nuclease subunit A
MTAPRPGSGLDRSWVVEASAGTGKTTALVNRIVEVIAGGTPVQTIAAVTFTHAAAGNMKLRVRQELEARQPLEDDPTVKLRLGEAARSLDRAFIGTIHAFCAQLLRRRPVEAGIDPLFQELAQPDALHVFGRVFQKWIEGCLAAPSDAMIRSLARLAWREERDITEPIDALRNAAWSIVEWRDFDAPWGKCSFDRDGKLAALVEQAEDTLKLRNFGRLRDALYEGLRPLAEFLGRVRRARDAGQYDANVTESEILRLPGEVRWLKEGSGKYAEGVAREAVFASWERLTRAIQEFRESADADLATHLRDDLWQVVELYQKQKARSGQLDFMDLLLCARNLLRHDRARTDLQKVYQRIFVDEFQDTDPLQAEVLLLLAAEDPTERDWRKVRPSPGKLYVVGDPKQSIYRFRRADSNLFRRVCQNLIETGTGFRELTSSTRSTRAIQRFVNAAFATSIPYYLALAGGVDGPEDQPSVVALPMPEPYGSRNLSNAKIEECSPNAVAAFIQWLCNESGWKVRDRSSGELVSIKPEHICILFRRFTNFGIDLTQEYVRCLEARGIAHLLVGSKSFHRREEVGTLRSALRAVEWPDDELSVYALLRGGLYAVLDGTLLRFGIAYEGFHPMRELPADLDPEFEPIRAAFILLKELHRRRNYRPIADTINELLEDTRTHAAFAFRKGGERVLANVYRLTELARSFEISGIATSFRAFVEYLEVEYEGGDAGEAPILEQEGGGVQLMTVHKAKGLEFPIVILADLTAKLVGPQGPDRFCDAERRLCAQRLLGCAPWELLDATDAERRADEEEALRLAYVAATRARDLLIVTAIGEEERKGGWLSPMNGALYPPKERWRIARSAPGCPPFGSATVLNRPPDQMDEVSVMPGLHRPKSGEHEVVWFDPAILSLKTTKSEGVENERVLTGTRAQAEEGLRRYQEFKDRRAKRIATGSLKQYRVATAEAFDGPLDGDAMPVEVVRLPMSPGRPYGKRFGRLVHQILQHAESVDQIADLARIWARRHGATNEEKIAAGEAAHNTLDYLIHTVPRDAKSYRELPIMVRMDDGILVDGRIDFAWSDGKVWSIIDYKTDRRASRNLTQLHLYGLALRRDTGLLVKGIVLEI